MTPLFGWIEANWFSVLQSAGIVGGLAFTACSLRREDRSRRASLLIDLTEQHRELWSEVHRRPELQRILQPDVDLVGFPVTTAESEFLNLVIVHFHTGWQLASQGLAHSLPALQADARDFFNLPLPRTVWECTKSRRDPDFNAFVSNSIESTTTTGPRRREF